MTRALRYLLPDLTIGVRAAIATVLPFFLAIELARPELVWVALGGWLGAMADPGGARRTRASAIFAFAVLGGIVIAAGMAATVHPPLGGIVLAIVAFCGALARTAGGAAATLGTLLAHADRALTAWSEARYHGLEQVAARREVGAALEHAEASLERMLSEPARTRDDPKLAVFLVTYLRRLSNALTALDAIEVRFTPDEIALLRRYLGGVLARARAVVIGTPSPGAPPEPPVIAPPSPAVRHLLEYARLVGQIEQ